ncbi:MAG: hypothetical protein WBM62_19915, partial [Crocosphaera sp.]
LVEVDETATDLIGETSLETNLMPDLVEVDETATDLIGETSLETNLMPDLVEIDETAIDLISYHYDLIAKVDGTGYSKSDLVFVDHGRFIFDSSLTTSTADFSIA